MSSNEVNLSTGRDLMADFEVLMQLAMDDPEAYETERQAIIDSFLASVPENKKRRLIGLQWKIDQVRKLSKTPLAACLAISSMMQDSLDQLRHYQLELVKMNPFDPEYQSQEQKEPELAKVLPFTRH